MAVTATQKTHVATLVTLLGTIEATCVRSDDDQAALWNTCKRIRREVEAAKQSNRTVR